MYKVASTAAASAASESTSLFDIPPGNYSVKSRIKKPELERALSLLCARYGTTIMQSTLRVVENRKIMYVLQFGAIDNLGCFINANPSATSADRAENFWKSTVVPNGWKSAVINNGELWICETRIRPPYILEYRFLLVDENGREISAQLDDIWDANPTAAYKLANKTEPKHASSLNGRLLAGILYDYPQQILRHNFNSGKYQTADLPPEIIMLITKWLANEYVIQSSSAATPTSVQMQTDDEQFSSILDALIDNNEVHEDAHFSAMLCDLIDDIDNDSKTNSAFAPALIFSAPNSSSSAAVKRPKHDEEDNFLSDDDIIEMSEEDYMMLDATLFGFVPSTAASSSKSTAFNRKKAPK